MQNIDIVERNDDPNETVDNKNGTEETICQRACCSLVQQIFQIVNCLEKTLQEDEEQDYKLWMTLGVQTQKIKEMHIYLDTEKNRTQRLMELVRGQDLMNGEIGSDAGASWPGSVISLITVSSISPLLMKQRYDELSVSFENYKRMLTLRNSQLTTVTCNYEKLRANFDYLLEEFNVLQTLLENLCYKYFRMQERKNQEIDMLKEALSCASDCILSAEAMARAYYNRLKKIGHGSKIVKKFVNKLYIFKNCLRSCKRKEFRRRALL